MKRFLQSRKKLLLGLLINFGVFFGFIIVIFRLRYELDWVHVLRFPFALLVPGFWPQDPALLAYNVLITMLPLAGVLFAIIQPRNGNMVAVAHIALVLYWTHVFRVVLELVGI